MARDVQIRDLSEPGGGASDYLSFRLEQTDGHGNVVEQIPVEMEGNIPGRVLRDGDDVVVVGRRWRHRALKARAVYVVATDSVIRPRRWGWAFLGVLLGILGAVLLVAFESPGGALLVPLGVVLVAATIWRNR